MSALTGAGVLTRLAVRRSRILCGAWIAAFVVVAAVSADATVGLYPSVSSRVAASETFNRSQALVALYGRVYAPSSVGALAIVKLGGLGAVFVAMLAVTLVVRHTRADEEAGRLELVAATAVGRTAPLAAALGLAAAVNLVLGGLTAVALAATGLPVAGSVAFGLAWTGVGLVFAAVAGVAAQLTTSARGATGLAAAVLAVVYAIRAVGDAASAGGPRWLSWLSPVGWAQQFRPFAGERWWVLVITLACAVVVGALAFWLAAHRDLGTGMLPERVGVATAPRSLGGPLGLAWRLQRGALVAWAIAFAGLGALVGGLASSVGDFINNPSARDFVTKLGGEQRLVDAFLALELGFAGIVAAGYGIHAVMRLRSEETALHAEPVLATSVGRVRWAMGHVLVAVAGTTLLMVLAGLGAGTVRAIDVGDAGEIGRVLAAALVHLPAVWVLAGLVVAAFGVAPRAVVVGWIALAAFVLLAELGPLLDLSHWVMDVSPFAHVPNLPGGAFHAAPVVALLALALGLTVAGLAGFRRRDLT